MPLAKSSGYLCPFAVGALTVGDLSDFVERGGMIGLVPFGERYRFAVNLGVARQVKLRISSHLLNLAMTVK